MKRKSQLASSLALVAALAALAGCSSPATARAPSRPVPPLKDASVLAAQGNAYADVGDFTRAEQYLAAALAAGAKSSLVLPRLLKACVASGHLRLASEYAEAELARSPRDARLRFLTGAIEASLGERMAARAHLEKAARDLPNDPEVQISVAAFFRDHMKDQIVAEPYFQRYLKLAPRGEHAEEARASLMEHLP